MRTVAKHLRFPVPAHVIWNIVGDVSRIDWVPVITSCTLEGNVRTMQMAGVGTVQERILLRDPDALRLEYGLINNPNVSVHRAILRVIPHGDECDLHWSTEIEPDALEPLIDNGMQSALDALQGIVMSLAD